MATCKACGNKVEFVRGRLEGVSFCPEVEERRFIGRGVYGPIAEVCPDCGRIQSLQVDVETLSKIMRKHQKKRS